MNSTTKNSDKLRCKKNRFQFCSLCFVLDPDFNWIQLQKHKPANTSKKVNHKAEEKKPNRNNGIYIMAFDTHTPNGKYH